MRIIASYAISLDGKLTPAYATRHVQITSAEDVRRLKILRDEVDAVVLGGESFRAWPKVRIGHRRDRYPVHCILTRSINLPLNTPLFQQTPPVPVLVFSPQSPSGSLITHYSNSVRWFSIGEGSPFETVKRVLNILNNEGLTSLLIEAGGRVLTLFLEAQVVQELYLTLCPILFGDRGTPGLISGIGFSEKEVLRCKIISVEQMEEEIFLRLRVVYPSEK